MLQDLSDTEIEQRAAEYAKKMDAPVFLKITDIWAKQQKAVRQKSDTALLSILRLGDVVFVFCSPEMVIHLAYLLDAPKDMIIIHGGNSFFTTRYVADNFLIDKGEYEGFESCFAYGTLPIRKNTGENLIQKINEKMKTIL